MAPLTFEIEGLDELERKFVAGDRAMATGIARAVGEGLAHGADYARANHGYQDRKHKLTDSIGHKLENYSLKGSDGIIEAKADHAVFIEEGTKPHSIDPKTKKRLHWVEGGRDVFARHVDHPGTEARPFLQPAALDAERHIERSIELDVLLNVERIVGG